MTKQVVPTEIRGQGNHIKYLDQLRSLSRINRQSMNRAELRIWIEILRNKKLGFKFFRQKPLGKFIADFYCSKLALIVEVDGSSHNNKINTDKSRDVYFQQRGIVTIRFTNDGVLYSLELVRSKLREIIAKRKSDLGL